MKVIVGSHAHGLANENSDYDYRGVFVERTSKILELGNRKLTTSWNEGKDDDTSWELGHFLHLSTKSNPTILETYLAPRLHVTSYGEALRELFPYVWSSVGVRDAFIGYGLNQQKKFLDNKDNRRAKYAAAYLRTLYNGWELLSTGTFTIKIADTPVGETVRKFKSGDFTIGEVIDVCQGWIARVHIAYEKNPKKQPNIEKINEVLLSIRRNHW